MDIVDQLYELAYRIRYCGLLEGKAGRYRYPRQKTWGTPKEGPARAPSMHDQMAAGQEELKRQQDLQWRRTQRARETRAARKPPPQPAAPAEPLPRAAAPQGPRPRKARINAPLKYKTTLEALERLREAMWMLRESRRLSYR